MRVEKKAFAYRVPIGDYNYLQCCLGNLEVSAFKFAKVRTPDSTDRHCRMDNASGTEFSNQLLLTFYYTYYSIISTLWKKIPQYLVICAIQSPHKYFHYMKNQKYGKKIRLDIYKCLA